MGKRMSRGRITNSAEYFIVLTPVSETHTIPMQTRVLYKSAQVVVVREIGEGCG